MTKTNGTVALKMRAALDAGLTPLVCVGEPAAVRDAADAVGHVVAQVRSAVSRVAPAETGRVLVAYEPVWAIGEHGRPATAGETGPVMAAVAEALAEHSDGGGPRGLLYGGSVHAGNVADLLDGRLDAGWARRARAARGRRPAAVTNARRVRRRGDETTKAGSDDPAFAAVSEGGLEPPCPLGH